MTDWVVVHEFNDWYYYPDYIILRGNEDGGRGYCVKKSIHFKNKSNICIEKGDRIGYYIRDFQPSDPDHPFFDDPKHTFQKDEHYLKTLIGIYEVVDGKADRYLKEYPHESQYRIKPIIENRDDPIDNFDLPLVEYFRRKSSRRLSIEGNTLRRSEGNPIQIVPNNVIDQLIDLLKMPKADRVKEKLQLESEWIDNFEKNQTQDIEVDQEEEGEDVSEVDDLEFIDSQGIGSLKDIKLEEKYLKFILASNLNIFFPDYKFIQTEYRIKIKEKYYRIDILSKDEKASQWIVFELKVNNLERKDIGQIMTYMGYIQEHNCSDGETVKGILLGKGIPKDISYAIDAIPNLETKQFEFDLRIF